jgi:hypothetical protein
MSNHKCYPKFQMGQLLATPGAMSALVAHDIAWAIVRHLNGDWGILDEHDRKTNDEALKSGGRIFSVYLAQDGTKFWIITECDRSATTVLLPEEY